MEREQKWIVVSLADFESSTKKGNLVEWVYDSKEFNRMKEQDRKEWKQRWPESTESRNAKSPGVRINASAIAHRELAQFLIPQRPKAPKTASSVFSGEINSQLKPLLEWIANRNKIEFHPLPLPTEYATKTISLNVKNVTVDELLDLVAKDAAIEFKKSGNRVEIVLPVK